MELSQACVLSMLLTKQGVNEKNGTKKVPKKQHLHSILNISVNNRQGSSEFSILHRTRRMAHANKLKLGMRNLILVRGYKNLSLHQNFVRWACMELW